MTAPTPPLLRESAPLRGDAALGWWSDRGVEARAAPSVALLGSEDVRPGLVLRRLGHSPAALHRSASAIDAGAVLLVLPLEGEFVVSSGRGPARRVGRGRLGVIPGGTESTITTSGSSARLEVLARPSAVGARRAFPPGSGILVASSPIAPIVVTAANAVLEARIAHVDPASAGVLSTFEGLLAAVLDSATPG